MLVLLQDTSSTTSKTNIATGSSTGAIPWFLADLATGPFDNVETTYMSELDSDDITNMMLGVAVLSLVSCVCVCEIHASSLVSYRVFNHVSSSCSASCCALCRVHPI